MNDPKEVGKELGFTRKESTRNAARVQANFVSSQRSVDDVNPSNIYLKEFSTAGGATASLDLDIKERPEPCTVNPPEVTSYVNSTWSGTWIAGSCPDGTGFLYNWRCTGIGSTTGEYDVVNSTILGSLIKSVIIIPYDGCYLIEVDWGAYGVSYYDSGGIDMGVEVRGPSGSAAISGNLYAGMTETGYIITLGPWIHYTPSPQRLIGMVEAKAGDTVSMYANAAGFSRCYPWFGTYLRGLFAHGPANMKITLVALAEDILPSHLEYAPESELPPASLSKACINANYVINTLNNLVNFYDRLTAKGERPYANESWTLEENWAYFWADYWSRMHWTYDGGPFPWPPPFRYSDPLQLGPLDPGDNDGPWPHGLIEYQAEWTEFNAQCPPQQTYLPDDCDYYWAVNDQLQRLREFYDATPYTPIYINISGSTEPTFFEDWATFWAWVWDRGYWMQGSAYHMDFVWTEATNTATQGKSPWPPPTTIEQLDSWIATYKVIAAPCYEIGEPPPPPPEDLLIRYISPDGDDTDGLGSFENPWATIQRYINSQPAPGSTLYCRGGLYFQPDYITSGWRAVSLKGEPDNVITIRNHPGESPVFRGGLSTLLDITRGEYIVIDGLEMEDREMINGSSYISIGGGLEALYALPNGTDPYPAHHITIRNCKINLYTPNMTQDIEGKAITILDGSDYITIENCEIVGPGVGNGGGDGILVHVVNYGPSNGPINITIQRNIFRNWNKAAIKLWYWTIYAGIVHNTFIDNTYDCDFKEFIYSIVRDCAFDSPSGSTAFYEQNPTESLYNFFSQVFDYYYQLVPGSTGIRAASDGTDAGALQTSTVIIPTEPHYYYYISPSGSDTTGNGTISNPWASVSKFLDVAVAGDTLYCRGGNYASTGNQQLRVQGISGTSGLPITIRNYLGETPVFHGSGGTYTWFLFFQGGSSYWVIDGLHTSNDYQPTGCGVITLYDGNSDDGGAHYITIRNCKIVWRRYMTQQEHCIYPGAGVTNCIIEDNVFLGEWQQGDVNGGCGINWGSHYPAPINLIVRRNVFKSLDKGIYVDDISPYGSTGEITHNTFIGCEENLHLERHRALLVRDNAGTDAIWVGRNLYDPNDSVYTTADHNYWDQEFNSSYLLLAGETGRGAASDGKDAGALDW
jgi:hypothetical protein